MFRFVLLAGCAGLLALAGCSDTGAADAQAIKAKSEDWIKAAAAKDAAKFASVYADDATIMFANEPAFKGVDAIKKLSRVDEGLAIAPRGGVAEGSLHIGQDAGNFDPDHLEEASGRLLEDRRGHFQ